MKQRLTLAYEDEGQGPDLVGTYDNTNRYQTLVITEREVVYDSPFLALSKKSCVRLRDFLNTMELDT